MSKNKQRKRLFVNRAIQGRLLGRTALYWVLYHGVLWLSLFMFRFAEYRGRVMAGATPRTFNDLYGQFVMDNYSLWICSLAILPIVLWDLLTFSHRVVGPLVRFQNALKSLTAGEQVSEIRLRDHDLLIELQDSFNAYLKSQQTLKSQQAVRRAEDDNILPFLQSVSRDADEPTEQLEETVLFDLRQLQEKLETLRSADGDQTESAPSRSSAEQIVS